jgi:nucleotide-binding universal stress UspA family protein
VVVGVDGSEQSTAALGFAFEWASGHGLPLVAVYAWRGLPTANLGPVTAWHYDPVQARQEAARLLAEQLAGWPDKYMDVSVARCEVLSFNPAETLVDASRTASLVVVGSRGRGGFAGLLLGSVSRTLVHHACGPVAVVHPYEPTA